MPTHPPTLPCLFRLELPPTSNHQYEPILRRGRNGRLVHGKRWSDAYQAWRDGAALVVRDWQPPKQTPLAVSILLAIPSKTGRNADIDGYIKPLLDATVGKLHDQWVDHLEVDREIGTGYAIITITTKEEVCPARQQGLHRGSHPDALLGEGRPEALQDRDRRVSVDHARLEEAGEWQRGAGGGRR